MGGGLYLLFVTQFLPLIGLKRAILLIAGKYHHRGEERAEGQISHFQALSAALAATIGLGNIGGVAIAITQGGPGAIFWMWVSALIGMNTKFVECSLSVMFRGKDYRGEVQGGPMYVIQNALPKRYHFLAYFFAGCGVIGCLSLFQINQLSSYLSEQYKFEPVAVGLVCAIIIAYALFGGIRRLVKITSSLVPLMCIFYVVICTVIISLHAEKISSIFVHIFSEAFSGRALGGGILGVAFIEVMKTGVKRAAFSNEAGVGTAPMAHSNVKTSEPISEGLVAMAGPFLDTIIVCTMTALVILTSLPAEALDKSSGVLMTLKAFDSALPGFGGHFLGVAIVLFSFTTMVGYANYSNKCWDFLWRGRFYMKEKSFILFYCSSIVVGAVWASDDVINLLDISFAFMAVPNIISIVILSPKVKVALNEYFKAYQ